MSDQDNFAGGFVAGVILGGVLGGALGGVLGVILAERSRPAPGNQLDADPHGNSDPAEQRPRRRWVSRRLVLDPPSVSQLTSEARLEEARRSLEDKIAQLNTAIDDARQQLNDPPGRESSPQSVASEPPQGLS